MSTGSAMPEPALPVPVLPDHVVDAYGLDGADLELLAGGRTNTTMRARGQHDLVVQQLHAAGHRDLLGVMENLVRVTSHLDWRRRTVGVERDPGVGSAQPDPVWFPQLVPAVTGKPFLMDSKGDVWRAFVYRRGVIVRTAQPHKTTASIARLYGRFAAETADLGGPDLIETAPGFHDLDRVFNQLIADLEAAPAEHGEPIKQQRDRIESLYEQITGRAADDGLTTAPRRVVHNDTKFSNVLLDVDGGQAVAVLDLDLVMMGPAWHDFGDLVRSASWHQPAGTGPALSLPQFSQVVDGYADGCGETLEPVELVTFALAGPRLSFELGLRYLNDHVRARPRLRVDGKNGHFRRGLANLNLADEMFGAYDALRSIVDTRLRADTAEPKGT